jgi:hypothetical protein
MKKELGTIDAGLHNERILLGRASGLTFVRLTCGGKQMICKAGNF